MALTSLDIINKYYTCYNQRDLNSFLTLLDDHVIHYINQGKKEIGKQAFAKYMEQAFESSNEIVKDLIIFINQEGTRVATEFKVEGKYLRTYADFPEASGQHYQLACGAFFELKNDKIIRVTVYYNLNDWLQQIVE